ncbi:arginine:ornithine antiporter/lysine permease [Enterococcus sp. AZ071]
MGFYLGSLMIWLVVLLVSRGIRAANVLNVLATFAKVVPIFIGIFILIAHFRYSTFSVDLFAKNIQTNSGGLGSLSTQVKHAMLQTMWVFVGIEGAVVLSGRAKRAKDVGRATLIGYGTTLAIYVLIVMLSFGILSQETLMQLPNPSLSGVLNAAVGPWGARMIDVGVIISVLGAWISWTILAAEISYDAANDQMFPAFLGKENRHQAPVNALILNGLIMQVVFIFSRLALDAFQAVTDTATTMVLIPYVLSAGFLWRLSNNKKVHNHRLLALGAILYGVYMLYSSGFMNLLYCVGIYALGFSFWLWNSHTYQRPLFQKNKEKYLFAAITALGILSLIVLLIQLNA